MGAGWLRQRLTLLHLDFWVTIDGFMPARRWVHHAEGAGQGPPQVVGLETSWLHGRLAPALTVRISVARLTAMESNPSEPALRELLTVLRNSASEVAVSLSLTVRLNLRPVAEKADSRAVPHARLPIGFR